MRYNQELNYRRRKRFIRRVWIAVLLLITVAVGFVGFLYYENFKASNFNAPEQTKSAPTTSTFTPSIQIFRSPYFQFQADKYWSEDTASTKDGKYVYRSLRSGLLEHQMTIYVNTAPSKLAVTRVLAAKPNGDRGLKSVKVSDQCGKSSKVQGSAVPVTLEKVTFTCFTDDTRFNVVVGLENGTPAMSLPRPDGSSASYTIEYANLKANPEAIQLESIVDSFQTR